MASDAPLICLRCDKEIPDESMTHRVVYVDDKGRLPPLDSWGSFTYHPECAAALRRERGVPQTHWTSPPRARPMVSDTDEQFPPGGYDKHGCACEDDPEYAKLLKRPPGCGPLEPPEDPRAIRVIAALSSEAASLRDELAAARAELKRLRSLIIEGPVGYTREEWEDVQSVADHRRNGPDFDDDPVLARVVRAFLHHTEDLRAALSGEADGD